jgi:hypothetical protein
MLNSRGIVNHISVVWVLSSDQRMSPVEMDRRNSIGGLAMGSLAVKGNTRRPFYPEEVRDELGPN